MRKRKSVLEEAVLIEEYTEILRIAALLIEFHGSVAMTEVHRVLVSHKPDYFSSRVDTAMAAMARMGYLRRHYLPANEKGTVPSPRYTTTTYTKQAVREGIKFDNYYSTPPTSSIPSLGHRTKPRGARPCS